MKAKKILFLTVLSLVLLLGLAGTGTALAGPAGPTIHHMHVTGTLVDVNFAGPAPVLDPGGTTWHETGTWAATFLGDLQGTFTEPATLHGTVPWEGHFWWQGTATFGGKLRGVPISFTYKDMGWGYDGFNAPAAKLGTYEEVRAVYTITGSPGPFSHLRGMIYVHTYIDATGAGGTTYCGDLIW